MLNRVDTVGPPGRTVEDRGAAGVDLGATGWKKTSYRRAVDNGSPRSSRSPTVSPCCKMVQVRFITVYPGGNTPG